MPAAPQVVAVDPRPLFVFSGFLGELVVKNPPATQETRGMQAQPRAGTIPTTGNGSPLPYSCLQNFMVHGQRSSAGPVHGSQGQPWLCVPFVHLGGAGPCLAVAGGGGAALYLWHAGLAALRHVGSWLPA